MNLLIIALAILLIFISEIKQGADADEEVQGSCNSYAKYRTYDGSCNNLMNPSWGKAKTPQRRFEYNGHKMVDYDDDVDHPRGGLPSKLPSPRLISNKLMAEELGPADQSSPTLSGQHFAFGQALTHDFISTKITTTYREQINDVTSYIDCSHVYGSSDAQLATLRDTTDSFLLKTSPGNNLPEKKTGFCRRKPESTDFCQLTGDSRNDQVPSLQLNHLVLVREHNRLAKMLKQINPYWDNDRVFEETRRIVIAEMQHITYNEYLPAILSPRSMKRYNLRPRKCGFDDCYNVKIDAAVRNAFSAAAFRMGHSQTMREQSLLADDFKTKKTELLVDNFFMPHLVQTNQGANVKDFTRWLTFTPANKIDSYGVNSMRNRLFNRSSDLFSTNIQRGRDQGVPSYNDWREFCGLKRFTFQDFPKKLQYVLQDLYTSCDDIDLYVGGLLERSKNGRVGETFACLIGKQFHLTKYGDRYWYERKECGFTEAQLNAIKKMTMSKVLCENFGLDRIQKKAFLRPENKGKLRFCDTLPGLNLFLWREEEWQPDY
ncbi:chorion peroxidase-like [Mytilus edulis]|uniref:chorion peroxidase-like n=1 Tax=Mytilus edulis TaxID=6550 RepID=UPI0039EE2CE8